VTDWEQLNLNSGCDPAAEQGTIRFPKGAENPGSKRVLLTAGNRELLLKVDYRADGGGGACLSGADFQALGSPTRGRYRPIGIIGCIGRDRGLQIAAAIAVLTFVLAVAAAITTLAGSTSWVVAAVFVGTLILAALNLWKAWNDL
jgi:hypothetical protein